jgi:hypothetical protein
MHNVRAINQRARLLREVVRGSRCQRSKSSIKPSRLAINGKDRIFEVVEPSREADPQRIDNTVNQNRNFQFGPRRRSMCC